MNVNKEGISIITIVLNGESSIEETILSVIQQKNVMLEYIIIDGGSTDQTLKIISKYNDCIDLVISEKDNGIYFAINKGIALANYNLIGLIHCGDTYHPEALCLSYNEFKKTGADIIYGDINYIEYFRDDFSSNKMTAEHSLLKSKMSLNHPATFVSKKCYEKNGLYDTNYSIAADYDYFLKLFIKNVKFSHIPFVLANFRQGGISTTRANQLIKENYTIRKNNLGWLSAVKYLITKIPSHMFYSIRKYAIELMIGKKNFTRLKMSYKRRKGLMQYKMK